MTVVARDNKSSKYMDKDSTQKYKEKWQVSILEKITVQNIKNLIKDLLQHI